MPESRMNFQKFFREHKLVVIIIIIIIILFVLWFFFKRTNKNKSVQIEQMCMVEDIQQKIADDINKKIDEISGCDCDDQCKIQNEMPD